jgi:hypothetical protein
VPALQIFAALLLVLGSVVVFRVLIESDRLLEEDAPFEGYDSADEEVEPRRLAA